MRRAFQILLFVGMLAAATKATAGPVLYGANGSGGALSTLYRIDSTTGVGIPIGPIGFSVTGLAFDPTSGVLYGAESRRPSGASRLMIVNTATGAGTIVGSYGLTDDSAMADITFDASGNLYGWLEPGGDDLYRISKTTGAATLVGNSGLITATAGLSFDNTGVLYLEANGSLFTIDPLTGAFGFAGSGPLSVGMGMDVNDVNVMYAIHKIGSGATGARELATVNLSNGSQTIIGPTVAGLDALAFEKTAVPEPASVLLLATGIVGLIVNARRK